MGDECDAMSGAGAAQHDTIRNPFPPSGGRFNEVRGMTLFDFLILRRKLVVAHGLCGDPNEASLAKTLSKWKGLADGHSKDVVEDVQIARKPPPMPQFGWKAVSNLEHCQRSIVRAITEMKAEVSMARADLEQLEELQSRIAGTHEENRKRYEALLAVMQPYRLLKDPWYRRIDVNGDTALIEIFKSPQLTERLNQLLAQVDKNIIQLSSESHQGPSVTGIELIQRDGTMRISAQERDNARKSYVSFRERTCVLIKNIVGRSLDRSERALAVPVARMHEALKRRHENQAEINKLANLATKNEQSAISPPGSDSSPSSDPQSDSALEECVDSYVPARWFYIKYLSYSKSISPIAKIFEDRFRSSRAEIYRDTLLQMEGLFVASRIRFLLPAFAKQVSFILNRNGAEELDLNARMAATFFLTIVTYETDLFNSYFNTTRDQLPPSLIHIITALGDTFYDLARSKVLGAKSLSLLRDLHDSLALDMEEFTTTDHNISHLKNLRLSPIDALARDVRERLAYRAADFVQQQIVRHQINPNFEENAFPTVLLEAQSDTERSKLYVPLVRKAAFVLLKVAGAINEMVARSIVHEVITETIDRLPLYIDAITDLKNADQVDQLLFLLRHCLHLHQVLDRFQFDITKAQRVLNFSRLKNSIARIFPKSGDTTPQKPQERSVIGSAASEQLMRPFGAPIDPSKEVRDCLISETRTTDTTIQVSETVGFLSYITPDLEATEFDARDLLGSRIADWLEALISSVSSRVLEPFSRLKGDALAEEAYEAFKDNLSSLFPFLMNRVALYIHHTSKVSTSLFWPLNEMKDVIITPSSLPSSGVGGSSAPASVLGDSIVERTPRKSSSGVHFNDFNSTTFFLVPTKVAIREGYERFLGQHASLSHKFVTVVELENLMSETFEQFGAALGIERALTSF